MKKIRFLLAIFLIIFLSLYTKVSAQNANPSPSPSVTSQQASSKKDNKSGTSNKNRQDYEEVAQKIEKNAETVLKNYEKNLKKLDKMLENTKKYYNKKLDLETGANDEIDKLFLAAIDKKATSYQSLNILKLEVNEFKKIRGNNGTPGALHRFERDANHAIVTFDGYKSAIGEVVKAVKGVSVTKKGKKN